MNLFVGTAGWAIPNAHARDFPSDGTGLQRYAAVFNAVEINSTFYRTHRSGTFERWRDSVPDGFRFSVKVPKAITHEHRLIDAERAFGDFVLSVAALGDRLGPLLLQLPPKFAFDRSGIEQFLKSVSELGKWSLMLERRHASWFSNEADDLLRAANIARVGADPQRVPGALLPVGARHSTYLRLHGSPCTYFSSYDDEYLGAISSQLGSAIGPRWCIFDNTASGAAVGDAIRLMHMLQARER